MRVVISQPRYLPAVNYLQRLYFVDLFIFLDNVQRQSRGWENRNKILINGEEKWVTIPVASPSREIIENSKVDGAEWIESHKKIICNAYSQHPFYDSSLVDLYYDGVGKIIDGKDNNFPDVIIQLLMNVCKIFGFEPKTVCASSYSLEHVKGPGKLAEICKKVEASTYVSGGNGREYGVIEAFDNSGVEVLFHEYTYPVYKQYKQDSFVSWLSFFDPLFNLGLEEVKKWVYEKPELSSV